MNVSFQTRQAYAELDTFIELLDDSLKNKIPTKLIEFLKREKDLSYVKNININIPIKEQNLKRETLSLIALINLEYLCEDENEKARLNEIYKKNEVEYKEHMKEKYNLNFLIKEEDKTTKEEIIEYKKESWYMKIIRKIKKLFSSKS